MSEKKDNLGSPQEWLARARSNLKLAQSEKTEEIYWEDLCFELQQCAEKSIKAVLLFKGIEFPYVHDIARLITLAKEKKILWTEELDEAAELSQYAVEARYPGLSEEVSEEEYKQALEVAKRVLEWAENTLGEH
ncbi:MAG: HEPN domain-containing protein [bacterium]